MKFELLAQVGSSNIRFELFDSAPAKRGLGHFGLTWLEQIKFQAILAWLGSSKSRFKPYWLGSSKSRSEPFWLGSSKSRFEPFYSSLLAQLGSSNIRFELFGSAPANQGSSPV